MTCGMGVASVLGQVSRGVFGENRQRRKALMEPLDFEVTKRNVMVIAQVLVQFGRV